MTTTRFIDGEGMLVTLEASKIDDRLEDAELYDECKRIIEVHNDL